MQNDNYFDIRHDLFKEHFRKGLAFADYVRTGEDAHISKWDDMAKRIELSDSQKTLLESFVREINVLVLSGTWCGDCVRQGPMLAAIEESCPLIKVRFIDNQAHPQLRDELRVCGGSRVPIVVALSEDFNEISRLGDRHLSVYRRMSETQLGAACDAGILPPAKDDLAMEISEWVLFFERVHLILRLSGTLRGRHQD